MKLSMRSMTGIERHLQAKLQENKPVNEATQIPTPPAKQENAQLATKENVFEQANAQFNKLLGTERPKENKFLDELLFLAEHGTYWSPETEQEYQDLILSFASQEELAQFRQEHGIPADDKNLKHVISDKRLQYLKEDARIKDENGPISYVFAKLEQAPDLFRR